MKPLSLLLLRMSTGLLLCIWGYIKLFEPDSGQHVTDKYYMGFVEGELIHQVWGAAEILLGLLVILGLWRAIVYPLQSVVLGIGALAVWESLIDPLGVLFGQDQVNLLFFPSSTVFFATLILLAFRADDTLSLDSKRDT